MTFNGLLEEVLSHWLAEVLILGAGIALAWLKNRQSIWLGPASYGLAGVALMSTIVFTFTGRAVFSSETPHTTTENIESKIRTWADTFGLGVQKQNDPESYFALLVTLHSGKQILVYRAKALEHYVQFRVNVALNPDLQAIANKLPKDQADRVVEEVTRELARSRVGFSGTPLGTLGLNASFPITSGLTEDIFAERLDKMESDIIVLMESERLAIGNGTKVRP